MVSSELFLPSSFDCKTEGLLQEFPFLSVAIFFSSHQSKENWLLLCLVIDWTGLKVMIYGKYSN